MTKEKERHFSFFLSGKTGGAKRRISRKRVTDFYSYIELSVVVLYFFQVFSSSAFVITSFIISQYTHYTLHPQIYIYTLFLLLFNTFFLYLVFIFNFLPFLYSFSHSLFGFPFFPSFLPSSTFCVFICFNIFFFRLVLDYIFLFKKRNNNNNKLLTSSSFTKYNLFIHYISFQIVFNSVLVLVLFDLFNTSHFQSNN